MHGDAELLLPLLPQGSFQLGSADPAGFGAARAGLGPDHAEFGGRGKVRPRGEVSSRQGSSEAGGTGILCPLSLSPQSQRPLSPQAAREDFRRSIAAAYISQGPSQREKSLLLLRALAAASAASRPRLKRSSARECFPSLWELLDGPGRNPGFL